MKNKISIVLASMVALTGTTVAAQQVMKNYETKQSSEAVSTQKGTRGINGKGTRGIITTPTITTPTIVNEDHGNGKGKYNSTDYSITFDASDNVSLGSTIKIELFDLTSGVSTGKFDTIPGISFANSAQGPIEFLDLSAGKYQSVVTDIDGTPANFPINNSNFVVQNIDEATGTISAGTSTMKTAEINYDVSFAFPIITGENLFIELGGTEQRIATAGINSLTFNNLTPNTSYPVKLIAKGATTARELHSTTIKTKSADQAAPTTTSDVNFDEATGIVTFNLATGADAEGGTTDFDIAVLDVDGNVLLDDQGAPASLKGVANGTHIFTMPNVEVVNYVSIQTNWTVHGNTYVITSKLSSTGNINVNKVSMSSNAGMIVGIVFGVLAALGLIGALIYYLLQGGLSMPQRSKGGASLIGKLKDMVPTLGNQRSQIIKELNKAKKRAASGGSPIKRIKKLKRTGPRTSLKETFVRIKRKIRNESFVKMSGGEKKKFIKQLEKQRKHNDTATNQMERHKRKKKIEELARRNQKHR